MSVKSLSRRSFLGGAAALTTGILAAACQPKVVEKIVQQTVVVTEKEVVKETVVVKEAVEVEKEVTRVVEKEAQPAGPGMVTLRVLTRGGFQGDHHRVFFSRYQSANPNIRIEDIEVTYADIPTKTEAMYRAGEMPDVCYSAVRWAGFPSYKGMFLFLDDLAEVNWQKYDFDDFYQSYLNCNRFEDKLYGIPEFSAPTSRPFVLFNVDMFEEAGVPLPEGGDLPLDVWSELAIKMTQPDKGIFGVQPPNLTSYYDWDAFVDGYDSHIVDEPVGYGKRFNFVDNPMNKEAVDWYLRLVETHARSKRGEDAPGVNMFSAERQATRTDGTYAIPSLTKEIGEKFRWTMYLMKGPVRRGTGIFVNPWCLSSQTKVADEAFDLVAGTLCGKEIGQFAFTSGLGNGLQARKSDWNSEVVANAHPGYGLMRDWQNAEGDKFAPFPIPWNLRLQELQDVYTAESNALAYGEETWESAAPRIQQMCQEILDQPRP
jgi:ABC-type glycerol-3-phosphate transport system substrate-binding protein